MSMTPDHEDFEQLRRLLALKRHEQPPPGYFNSFSQQVLARIRAGELGADTAPWERWLTSPLQRLWLTFETKPVLAGVFGAAVCALLISGVVYSERTGPTSQLTFSPDPQPAFTPVQMADRSPFESANPSPMGGIPLQSSVSVFDGIPMPQSKLASWSVPASN
jgi:hypothetical protein